MTERAESYMRLILALRSPDTARTLRSTLHCWDAFLAGRGCCEEAATTEEAAAFVRSRNWQPSTIYRMASQMRGYYRFLNLAGNPWDAFRPSVPPRRIPRPLSAEEWLRVEAAAAVPGDAPLHRDTVRRLRCWALTRFAFASGARNGEARSVRVEDLDMDRRLVLLRGKGRRERTVPFGQRTAAVLLRWLKDGRPRWTRHRGGPLFVTAAGDPLSSCTVLYLVRRVAASAGIWRSVYPHLLRHSYATQLLEGGATIREVQELLGHASLQTTEIYTHVRPERLRDAYDRAFADLG